MEVKEIQHALNKIGFGPVDEDGKLGNRTIAAIKRFQKANGLTADGKVGPATIKKLLPDTPFPIKKGHIMSTEEIISKYGPPGPSNLTTITLPFPMKIEWDMKYIAKQIQCHKLVANAMVQTFQDILNVYGMREIERLGINIYSGCYNFRKMRGGNDWSRHSWGIAIDLYSQKNQLKQDHTTALFFHPDYKNMIQCFYRNGFVGLGPEKDYDWMHFQIGE